MTPAAWLAFSAYPLVAAQGALMLVDELHFHRGRGLGRWESWGHVADSAVFAAVLLLPALTLPTPSRLALYAAGAAASTLLVAKDQWIHARECGGTEHWVHALLYSLHPAALLAVGTLWTREEGAALRAALPLLVLAISAYQWSYWIDARRFRADEGPRVDNAFYNGLGAAWHEGDTHAIALLRAETPTRLDYIRSALEREGLAPGARLLDVGCGGGLLANPLAAAGWRVKGLDLSLPSLEAARSRSSGATFARGDALALDEDDASYDAVLLMDVLEHLEDPARAVAKAARVLRPGGLLFFHTFNRTPEAWLLAVKGIGFVSREGPRNVHDLSMFIKPAELEAAGARAGLVLRDLRGIRPVLGLPFAWSLLHRRVHPAFAFTLTSSTRVGYLGRFVKDER